MRRQPRDVLVAPGLGSAILDLSPAAMATGRKFRRMFGDVDPSKMATAWLPSREGARKAVSALTVREAGQIHRIMTAGRPSQHVMDEKGRRYCALPVGR